MLATLPDCELPNSCVERTIKLIMVRELFVSSVSLNKTNISNL